VEPTVDLKPGARILLLKNIDTRNEAKKEQPLVNGTTGRILRWATADEAEAALKAREVLCTNQPTSRRWRIISTDVAAMAWGVFNLISTQAKYT
jgi:hypothetical protein